MPIRQMLIAAAFAAGLAAVPVSPAQAQYYSPCSSFPLFWPFCAAGALVGAAATIVTTPFWALTGTPTSCPWANAVESLFATLTRRRLQRGVFRSLVDLQAAINRYLGEHNRKPKPFVWTADPDRIIAKLNRGYQVLASDH